MPAPTVAIASPTGRLGIPILQAFLSAPHTFSHLTLFTRSIPTPTSPLSTLLAQFSTSTTSRTTIRPLDPSQLTGIDVLICCLPSSAHALRQDLARGLAGSGVKVYLPSEFGVDHYSPPQEFAHPEWVKKREHLALLREVAAGVRVCRVFAGMLLEESVGPWFGFRTREGVYESVGTGRERVSFTSLGDVGRVVVGVVGLLEHKGAEMVPELVRVAGDTRSMREVGEIMEREIRERGEDGEIRFTELDLEGFMEEVIKGLERGEGTQDPSQCLRFIVGQDRADLSDGVSRQGRDNELVTATEKWDWKTMADLAKETGGRPWADSKWKLAD